MQRHWPTDGGGVCVAVAGESLSRWMGRPELSIGHPQDVRHGKHVRCGKAVSLEIRDQMHVQTDLAFGGGAVASFIDFCPYPHWLTDRLSGRDHTMISTRSGDAGSFLHMSPFEIFRRNLKPLMVFLTGLALFAFVVLPAMDSYMRRGGGGSGTDAELASFDGKPLKRSRVEYLTRNHQSTVRFLRELAEETIRRGGAPQTPGFVYDTQNRRIQSIGINEQPSELGTVRTIQFANEAKKSGFELDDTAIASWLYSFTDQGTVSENEVLAMLMQSTRNQMGKFHLYEMLRSQLLAGLYQQGNFSGLVVNSQIPVVTPVEQWENFFEVKPPGNGAGLRRACQ